VLCEGLRGGQTCKEGFGGVPFGEVINELMPWTLPLTCTTCRACARRSAFQGQPNCLPEVGSEARFIVQHALPFLHLLDMLSL
jgi:hypothetical protein